jgi:hypothetical protein
MMPTERMMRMMTVTLMTTTLMTTLTLLIKNKKKKKKKKRISTPDSSEWGTCPNCKGFSFVGNTCSECNEDGMKLERHPKWYYKDAEGVIHIIDVTRRIICDCVNSHWQPPARYGYGK